MAVNGDMQEVQATSFYDSVKNEYQKQTANGSMRTKALKALNDILGIDLDEELNALSNCIMGEDSNG